MPPWLAVRVRLRKNDQALPLYLKSVQRGTPGKNKVRISDPVLVGFAMGRGEFLLYHLGLWIKSAAESWQNACKTYACRGLGIAILTINVLPPCSTLPLPQVIGRWLNQRQSRRFRSHPDWRRARARVISRRIRVFCRVRKQEEFASI